jgi:hypothetical protein
MALWGPFLWTPGGGVVPQWAMMNTHWVWAARRLIMALGLLGAWRHVRFAARYHAQWGVPWPRRHAAIDVMATTTSYFQIGTIILFIWALASRVPGFTLTPRFDPITRWA